LTRKVSPPRRLRPHAGDNRSPALARDTSTFVFASPQPGAVTLQVRLLFRRALIERMDQKDLDVPDILMESQTIEVEGDQKGELDGTTRFQPANRGAVSLPGEEHTRSGRT